MNLIGCFISFICGGLIIFGFKQQGWGILGIIWLIYFLILNILHY